MLRAWFRLAPPPAAPPVAQVRYWDKAATVTGCQTAGVLMARYADGRYHIHHVTAGQWSPADRDARMVATATAGRPAVPILIEQEPGSAGIDAIAAAVTLLAGYNVQPRPRHRRQGHPPAALPRSARSRPRHPEPGPLGRAATSTSCAAIPAGTFRDQADATAGAFNALARIPTTGPTYIVQRADPLAEIDREHW